MFSTKTSLASMLAMAAAIAGGTSSQSIAGKMFADKTAAGKLKPFMKDARRDPYTHSYCQQSRCDNRDMEEVNRRRQAAAKYNREVYETFPLTRTGRPIR